MHIHGGHMNPNPSLGGTQLAALAARRAEETRKKLFSSAGELDAVSTSESAWMVNAWAGGSGQGGSNQGGSNQGGSNQGGSNQGGSNQGGSGQGGYERGGSGAGEPGPGASANGYYASADRSLQESTHDPSLPSHLDQSHVGQPDSTPTSASSASYAVSAQVSGQKSGAPSRLTESRLADRAQVSFWA